MSALLYLILSLLVFATPNDKVDICRAFGRAEVYIELAESHYAEIYNYFIIENGKGTEDVSVEDWDAKIVPQAKKVAMFTSLAEREITSVMPDVIRTDLWKEVRGVLQMWDYGYTTFNELSFYQDEYLYMVAEYKNYLQMYFIILYNHWDMISKAKDKLMELKKQI